MDGLSLCRCVIVSDEIYWRKCALSRRQTHTSWRMEDGGLWVVWLVRFLVLYISYERGAHQCIGLLVLRIPTTGLDNGSAPVLKTSK